MLVGDSCHDWSSWSGVGDLHMVLLLKVKIYWDKCAKQLLTQRNSPSKYHFKHSRQNSSLRIAVKWYIFIWFMLEIPFLQRSFSDLHFHSRTINKATFKETLRSFKAAKWVNKSFSTHNSYVLSSKSVYILVIYIWINYQPECVCLFAFFQKKIQFLRFKMLWLQKSQTCWVTQYIWQPIFLE